MTRGRPPGMRVLLTHPVDSRARMRLAERTNLTRWPGPYPIPADDLARELFTQDGLLCLLGDPISSAVLDQSPQLRVVANLAVGYDNIDLVAASRLGIVVTNTPDVLTEATAELTWAILLALVRGVVPARQALLDGQWRYWSPTGFLGRGLGGKTLGVVGLGRIGQAVAARAAAFGMSVVVLGSRGQGPYPRLEREAFLATADVVSLHVPLTTDTRRMVDESFLARMKPGAFLVNTARGGLVDEDALLAALNTGRLAGAALDVFDREPVDGQHPLAAHPRVLATPHIGSATVETRAAMAERAVDNLLMALTGQRPRDLVNAAAWPGRCRYTPVK
ncbi:MAG: D-glycerate dehydrogenase [Thermaerobacter sp.]|nr:D-glycerate dehydrogenase [Thermaerobacter sp.]